MINYFFGLGIHVMQLCKNVETGKTKGARGTIVKKIKNRAIIITSAASRGFEDRGSI